MWRRPGGLVRFRCLFLLSAVAALVSAAGAAAAGSSSLRSGAQQQKMRTSEKSGLSRPFLAEFKVKFSNALGMEPGMAAATMQGVNTPGSNFARMFPGSVSKMAGPFGVYPPPAAPVPSGPATLQGGPTDPYQPAKTSMAVANHALGVAKQNEAMMRAFSDKLYRAAEAHSDGLTYSDKTMGGAPTDAPPSFARLVVAALQTTPPPTLPPMPK